MEDTTLAEAFKLDVALLETVKAALLFLRIKVVRFFIVAEIAIALIRQTAGAATRIKRTITLAKYMLVRPYMTMNIVASDNRLKQKYRPAGKRIRRMWKSNIKDDHAVG